MSEAVNLAELRGLHLPADAAGAVQGEVAVAVALGFAAALLIGLARLWRQRAAGGVRRTALRELAASRGLDPAARRVAQARLLRRLLRTLDGEAAADAQGEAFAARLDALLRTEFFTKGAGRVLAGGLYRRPTPDADRETAGLDAEITRLITRIRA